MLTLVKETRKLATRWIPRFAPAAPPEDARGIDIPPSRQLGTLMDEVDCLIRKRVPIGLAVIRADIGPALCKEVKDNISRIADYFSWVDAGPVLVVAFQKNLFRELLPVWCELLAKTPCVAGVAFSDKLKDHRELLLGAKIALSRALALGESLIAFEDDEAVQLLSAQMN